MKDSITSVMFICVIGSFASSALNIEGKLYRYVGYVVSLMLICILLSPLGSLLSFFNNADDFFDFEFKDSDQITTESAASLVLSKTDAQLREGISDIARIKFQLIIPEENITIYYDDEDIENVDILSIKIELKDLTVIKNLNEFCLHISEMFMCKCEVV